MAEGKILQRLTRVEVRGMVFEVSHPAPRRGGPVVTKIGNVADGAVRVDLESKHAAIGDSDLPRDIRSFIIIPRPDSFDVEEMDGPKVYAPSPKVIT